MPPAPGVRRHISRGRDVVLPRSAAFSSTPRLLFRPRYPTRAPPLESNISLGRELFGGFAQILLEIGGSRGEWLCALREVGWGNVLVTGYLREQIARVLPELGRAMDEHPDMVNERFPRRQRPSVAAARGDRRKPRAILLMDADVLYPAQIFNGHPLAQLTALMLDREYLPKDDDPVLVPVKDGRPFEFRKKWTGQADLVGESIGFFKIDPRDLPMLIEETRTRMGGNDVRDSYDDVLRAMVLADRFGFEDVTSLPWTEIDFPDDLTRARDEVLPRIERVTESP